MKRAGLYLRVSTQDQSVEAQRLELREFCERRGWDLVRAKEYADQASGAKITRTGLDALMSDVRKRRLDVVLCVKLDRLGRSLPHLAQLVGELDAAGVALVCTSQSIDTSDANPAGRLQMHVLMAVAEFERSLIRERTKAGLVVARANGKRLGRPRFVMTPARQGKLAAWRALDPDRRCTLMELAEHLGCSIGTAHALAKEAA